MRLDTVTYPDPRVAQFVSDHFIPVRVNIREQPELGKAYHIHAAPTTVILDRESEYYRLSGFLPPQDFLAYLIIGRAVADCDRGKYAEAIDALNQLVSQGDGHPVDVLAEAWYWLGRARFKQSGDREAALPSWKVLVERYPQTSWAKRVAYLFE